MRPSTHSNAEDPQRAMAKKKKKKKERRRSADGANGRPTTAVLAVWKMKTASDANGRATVMTLPGWRRSNCGVAVVRTVVRGAEGEMEEGKGAHNAAPMHASAQWGADMWAKCQCGYCSNSVHPLNAAAKCQCGQCGQMRRRCGIQKSHAHLDPYPHIEP